ncbi:MAG TPA: Gfo/Idh/MocA family oxidoreductase [Methylomirabilota bacterium]|nr:Gfo/Idh/MocA family oxidoreductase [Methylomirabilota bacterium]
MNVLLVGLGRWGEKHLRVLTQLGATVWVADISPARRQSAMGQGVDAARAVADFTEALAHVEAVDIVTPADSHRAVAETCLAAGRHCFIEKPLTVSVADGRAVAALARQTGRAVQVGHIFRFHPVTATLKAALAADRIGAVRYATGRFSGFKRPRTDVGVTHTDAIHYFDLFAHLLGREATSVMALQRDYLGRGLDDMSLTTVTYGDVPVIVEANYFVPGTHRECVIVGERGALVADYGASTVTLHAGEFRQNGGAWEAVDTGKEDLVARGEEPLRLELEAFLAACQGRGTNPVPAEAGIHALEVVEAAAKAARLQRAVPIAEVC